jgi:hypothetical protein
MKAREMVAEASSLTWDNVAAILRNGAPEGFSTTEIAELLDCEYAKVGALMRAMYEAGSCARVQTGKAASSTTLYFAPLGG